MIRGAPCLHLREWMPDMLFVELDQIVCGQVVMGKNHFG